MTPFGTLKPSNGFTDGTTDGDAAEIPEQYKNQVDVKKNWVYQPKYKKLFKVLWQKYLRQLVTDKVVPERWTQSVQHVVKQSVADKMVTECTR